MKTSAIRKFFVFRSEDNTSVCGIEECGAQIMGNHSGNLTRHVQHCHEKQYSDYMKENSLKRKRSTEGIYFFSFNNRF